MVLVMEFFRNNASIFSMEAMESTKLIGWVVRPCAGTILGRFVVVISIVTHHVVIYCPSAKLFSNKLTKDFNALVDVLAGAPTFQLIVKLTQCPPGP